MYNEKNKEFVAYFKLYLRGVGYETSNVGVAVSKKPNGPFTYHHKFHGGGSPKGSGDFSMFKDDDGSLYHLTVRKPDKAFVIGKLDKDYYYPETDYQVCEGIEKHTEAPAVIKRKGVYHLLGSGSSGWNPNIARYYTTENILGKWKYHGNPCSGYNPIDSLGVEKTYGGQSSYIIPVQGIEDAWIAMFDIWKPEHPVTGRYIWLPVDFSGDKMSIAWHDTWDFNIFRENIKAKVSFVDPQSPLDAAPLILSDAAALSSPSGNWKLTFSDEFNDGKIDTMKWTIENAIKKRIDVTLYADSNQVEEKNGNMYVYYRKSPVSDTAYNAGRFNSKGKYAPTYGFLECRMHIVKPNGHQMAFWMMPEGNGMKAPQGVDGTANDGAEIDIMEGNKSDAYSNGLHWDGYAKPAHKSNGALMKTPGIHDQEYHVYGLEWTPTYLKFYYDGKVVREMNDPKLIPHVAHFIYFSGSCFGENNWVDGDFRKNEFIQNGGVDKSYIDYIRVYKDVSEK
jgi:beta-glucanase (GH16 family)